MEHDVEELEKQDKLDDETMDSARPWLMGQVAAVVNEKKAAKDIVDEMITEAVEMLKKGQQMLSKL